MQWPQPCWRSGRVMGCSESLSLSMRAMGDLKHAGSEANGAIGRSGASSCSQANGRLADGVAGWRGLPQLQPREVKALPMGAWCEQCLCMAVGVWQGCMAAFAW